MPILYEGRTADWHREGCSEPGCGVRGHVSRLHRRRTRRHQGQVCDRGRRDGSADAHRAEGARHASALCSGGVAGRVQGPSRGDEPAGGDDLPSRSSSRPAKSWLPSWMRCPGLTLALPDDESRETRREPTLPRAHASAAAQTARAWRSAAAFSGNHNDPESWWEWADKDKSGGTIRRSSASSTWQRPTRPTRFRSWW